jgi:hypothetical protein
MKAGGWGGRIARAGILIAVIIAAQLWRPACCWADEVTGCPKGLNEGEWWWRYSVSCQSMAETYDRATDGMVDLPAGWKRDVVKTTYRLGHSPQDRWEYGIALKTTGVNARLQKQGAWQEFNKFSLSDAWFSLGYMLCQDEEIGGIDCFNAKLGVGYKPDSVNGLSDMVKKHGLGNGTDEMRLGFSTNSQIGRWELCNHLFYHWRGTAPEIEKWQYSGQDLPDRLNYKFNVGYGIDHNVAFIAGLFGWMDLTAVELASGFENKGVDGQKLYQHQVKCALEYSPEGQEHNVIKLAYGMPVSVMNGMAPDETVSLIYMFTWE